MSDKRSISGFSKLKRQEKTDWLISAFKLPAALKDVLNSHLHTDQDIQDIYEEFSENTISNFFIPLGLAPNFLINNKWYTIPMVTEESSVVAAAAHAAKFWSEHGGFRTRVYDTQKVGQVHFNWSGRSEDLQKFFEAQQNDMLLALRESHASMEKRGGGIKSIELLDLRDKLDKLYQLKVVFYTADAMGANYINSVLEALAALWSKETDKALASGKLEGSMEVIMAILSNYTPESRVMVSVETEVDKLSVFDRHGSGKIFAERFVAACDIAGVDTYRAVTHNKGIFNGMDAVTIATGNDFRATEAAGHAYAARKGQYLGLSKALIERNIFRFSMEIPMAVGTVGGLTKNHPLAKLNLKILNEPSAEVLMQIIAAAGLASNFSAVRSLITTGIQSGHMKMHLSNILRQLGADETQKKKAQAHFSDKVVSNASVREFLSRTK